MVYYLTGLTHKFPTLNQLMTLSSYHKRMNYEKKAKAALREMLEAYDKPEVFSKLIVEYSYHYKKRDVDNTIPAVKYLLDVLCQKGWIEDDSPRFVEKVILKFDPEIKPNTQLFKLTFI